MENTLDLTYILINLKTRFTGKDIIYLPVTTSTNDIAIQQAKNGAPEGTIIIADKQTAGRGRLKRKWTSPSGTLAFSIILRPDTKRLSSLIMISSLAVLRTIEKISGIHPAIKWPNDILIGEKKVSGILIENGWKNDVLDYSVVGIGLNTNLDPISYPEIAETATSLKKETGRAISNSEVVRQLIVELDKYYFTESVFEEWKENLITLGKHVKVTDRNHVYYGLARTVNPDGSLVLENDDGSLVTVNTGDVSLH